MFVFRGYISSPLLTPVPRVLSSKSGSYHRSHLSSNSRDNANNKRSQTPLCWLWFCACPNLVTKVIRWFISKKQSRHGHCISNHVCKGQEAQTSVGKQNHFFKVIFLNTHTRACTHAQADKNKLYNSNMEFWREANVLSERSLYRKYDTVA